MLNRLQKKLSHFARQALLSVLAAMVFGAGFVAVLPEAHQCLHAHADQPEHHCWLAQLVDGSALLLDGTPVHALLPAFHPAIVPTCGAERSPLSTASSACSPRGPPAVASALA